MNKNINVINTTTTEKVTVNNLNSKTKMKLKIVDCHGKVTLNKLNILKVDWQNLMFKRKDYLS